MPTYTKKIVNGVVVNCTADDQAVLAARDAAGWTGNPATPATMTAMTAMQSPPGTAADRLARMAEAFGMTAAELKAEISQP